MRRWALVHSGIVTRLVEAVERPFHRRSNVVDVTAIPAQVGAPIDEHGNVGAMVALSPVAALERKKLLVLGEAAYHAMRGVWLPKNDKDGHRFDTHHEALAVYGALAAVSAAEVADENGLMVEIAAEDVLKAAGEMLAETNKHVSELLTALHNDAETDIAAGWPEDGEPDIVSVTNQTTIVPGTTVLPPVAPNPEPNTSAAATHVNSSEMPADMASAAAAANEDKPQD